jgi:hypothetical protein
MKKRRIIGGSLVTLSLIYALFNGKINGATIGINVPPTIIEIVVLGMFIGGLYMIISNRKE